MTQAPSVSISVSAALIFCMLATGCTSSASRYRAIAPSEGAPVLGKKSVKIDCKDALAMITPQERMTLRTVAQNPDLAVCHFTKT